MSDRNYLLLVGAYDDEASAEKDFEALKTLDDLAILGAVVASRDDDGQVTVKEHAGRLAAGTSIGAIVGLVVGLFAPPLLLLLGVAGAGVGAGVGAIVRRHEEKEIGVDAEEWLPAGSSAVVAIVDDVYADRVDKALERATKKINKAIDKGDHEAVAKAISEGDEKVLEALVS